MRDMFHTDLELVDDRLVEMTGLVGAAMVSATQALLTSDLQIAESVIAADTQIDRIQREIDEQAVSLLARQQPVATDLRVLVAGLRMSATLERMGDLARHIAKLARLRYPHPSIPEELHPVFARMGHIDELLALKAGRVIQSRDMDIAHELMRDDDELDALHKQIFDVLLAGDWSHPVEATVDVTLCSRYYERFGDHAVSLARRVEFLVTGEWDHVQANA
jgi:phosphate transport system protein